MSDRKTVKNTIEDLVLDLLYYDRKEDEELKVGAIEKLVIGGMLTEEMMVQWFGEALKKGLE